MDLTNNTSTSFLDLLNLKNFKIPDYQRAYSWGEKQIEMFISDLDEYSNSGTNKRYYLGHFILENNLNNEFEIVDGQQRLTSIILFMIVCQHLSKTKTILDEINFKPVSYDLDNYNSILKSDLNNLNSDKENKNETSSFLRMKEAIEIFKNSFIESSNKRKNRLDINKIELYLKIIKEAYCSFVIFNDKAVSSQVFELHNTRGLPLIETEKVKSTLMKMVYMYSEPNTIQSNINKIENAFSCIFKNEEKAKDVWFRGSLSLDNILMYHFRAVDDGEKSSNFSIPNQISGENGSFEYLKKAISEKNKNEIVEYCINVAENFKISMDIISNKIPELDATIPAIGDSILLDKNRSLVFLLRILRNDINTMDISIFKRWESFLFCNELIEWSGFFYQKKYRENFNEIYKKSENISEVNNLIIKYFKAEEDFAPHWKAIPEILNENFKNIERNNEIFLKRIYNNDKINIAYLLYKYEIKNHNVDYKVVREKVFKENTVSIDHIVAQNLTWEDFGYEDYEKNKTEADEEWKKVVDVIHGIGNLSLSTSKSNSSDSNKPPKDHLNTYSELGLKYTYEIVSSWDNPKKYDENIINRGTEILKFIESEFINNNDVWNS